MKFTSRRSLVTCLGLLLLAARPLGAATLDAVEYYNAALDHYFVTASANEIEKLDAGMFVGWQRTSYVFKVFDPVDARRRRVARLPLLRQAGRRTRLAFLFRVACRMRGSAPALSRRLARGDRKRVRRVAAESADGTVSRHERPGLSHLEQASRFQPPVHDRSRRAAGNDRARLCRRGLRTGSDARSRCARHRMDSRAPSCCQPASLSASNSTPNVGATIVLTATCTNAPTTFTWTGCVSSTATCSATSSAVGQVAYTVVARNARGSERAGERQRQLASARRRRPKCTLSRTSQTDPPVVNAVVVLKVNVRQDRRQLHLERMLEHEQRLHRRANCRPGRTHIRCSRAIPTARASR